MQASDDAGKFFVAKGNDDAAADGGWWFSFVVHAISEDAIERDGQGYVAEVWHEFSFQWPVLSLQWRRDSCR